MVGGEGFALVIHNDERGSEAIGCANTGIGFAKDASSGCTDFIANSTVIEFDTFFDVKMVSVVVWCGWCGVCVWCGRWGDVVG